MYPGEQTAAEGVGAGGGVGGESNVSEGIVGIEAGRVARGCFCFNLIAGNQ